MDGKRLSAAAKAVVTGCFLGFMILFCLDRLLIALAVLFCWNGWIYPADSVADTA